MSRLIRIFVWLIVIAAIGVFAYTLIHALWYSPESELSVPPSVATSAPAAQIPIKLQPNRLLIPALRIDANIQHVGIGKTGNMAVPTNYTDVGWYRYGTVPGQKGSAVIDGHVDNGLGLDGVFKHLQDIKLGDDVYVTTGEGKSLRFTVVDIEIYHYKSAPSEKIFDMDDAARLNLITCEGSWVSGDKTYDHRIVVYTKLVSG